MSSPTDKGGEKLEATKQISLDMLAVGIPPAVEAKQNDTARVIAASLYAGGNVFDVPVGAIAVFRYRKPDGTAGFYDALPDDTPAISIEGNVVTILLVEQVLTVPGDVQCEINLYNTAGEKLTTFTYCLRVQASVLTDAEIISSDYFNVLSEKVAQALQAAADAAASAQEAKDAAASINPGTYMQKTMYDPENKQKPYIPADEALSLESYGGSAVGVVSKADVAAACTGNAATAIKLATARKIGSANFDGSENITLAQMGVPNPNLLDNSDFINPVNQRGQASYTGGYCIDRWVVSNCVYTVATRKLMLTPTGTARAAANMQQAILWKRYFAEDDIITVSAKVNGEVFSVSAVFPAPTGSAFPYAAVDISDEYELSLWRNTNQEHMSVVIQNKEGHSAQGTFTVDWIKLEKGSIATPYIPKGYAVEWMECRRYYQHRCRAIAIKNNIDYYSITYWHGMGKIPTVKLLEFNYAGSGTVANSFGANDTLNCNEEWCSIAKLTNCTAYSSGMLIFSLSADL